MFFLFNPTQINVGYFTLFLIELPKALLSINIFIIFVPLCCFVFFSLQFFVFYCMVLVWLFTCCRFFRHCFPWCIGLKSCAVTIFFQCVFEVVKPFGALQLHLDTFDLLGALNIVMLPHIVPFYHSYFEVHETFEERRGRERKGDVLKLTKLIH